jgi:hypothetical protein
VPMHDYEEASFLASKGCRRIADLAIKHKHIMQLRVAAVSLRAVDRLLKLP